MQPSPQHPVTGPALPCLMAFCLVVGGGFAIAHETEHGSFLYDAVSVTGFASFVVAFGVYCLGWLLRGHEQWRQGRRHSRD